MKRTDMACDFMPHEEIAPRYVHSFTVTVNAALSQKLKRPKGKYCTVESRAVPDRNRERFGEVSVQLARALNRLVPRSARSVLVVGLGNPGMTADSLGAKTCARIVTTRRGAQRSSGGALSVLTPSVAGVTGVESFDVVAGVVERTRPDAVIAVDSLASAAASRIASAFQATDTGITPGSGVSNHRERLCRDSLGVPVVSLGVPLVVYASTLIEDATGKPCPAESEDVGNMVVTPKDIDLYVADCADILASAVMRAFL
ncbi:MAG: GPR endopeptidase [Clostridia bacterium]|nr:GPR endopeptidase [Clostridia bacterium]